MTPPVSPTAGQKPDEGRPAVKCPMETLRKRADFLAANSGRRAAMPGFVLLGRDRGDGADPRVGFTCSKKLGNAVTRNRAKRRLRALAREVLADSARRGWDYVLIGRQGSTVSRDYSVMGDDLARAAKKIHAAGQ